MKNIMKEAAAVDVNCAIGRARDRVLKFESAAELAGYLRKYHIARAVVSSLMSFNWNANDGDEWLFQQLAAHKNLIPCVTLSSHLGTSELPSRDELKDWLKLKKVKAAKVYPQSGGFRLDAFYAGALLELLDALRIPLLMDWSEVDPGTLPQVTADFPGIPFVLLNSGFRSSRFMYPLMEKRGNVFFDVGRFDDFGLIEEIVAKFGAGRLLFGSSMPAINPGAAITMVCRADIPDEDKVLILGGNWRRMEKEALT